MTFFERIQRMNRIMEIECPSGLMDLGDSRIDKFKAILTEELNELDDITKTESLTQRMVMMADLLGDVVVYCTSEAVRWGIPLPQVLDLIMDSQDSKLVDGKPIKDEATGKFLKGPNYVPPEPEISKLLFRELREVVQYDEEAEDQRSLKEFQNEELGAKFLEAGKSAPVVDDLSVPVGFGDGTRKLIKSGQPSYKIYQNHSCPACKTMFSDECVKRMHQNSTFYVCPECALGSVVIETIEDSKLTGVIVRPCASH